MKTLRDRVVVITGAGSGIGRALARLSAQRGARLAICDVDEAGLASATDELKQQGARVFAAKVDVAQRQMVETFASDVERALGPSDVVVSNAGISLSAMVEHMELEAFERVMNVNFWGVVYTNGAFLPQLRKRPHAHLVNISSVFGLIGVPSQAAYNASKFAVRGYTESLRQELCGSNVRVMCVHPGGVRTNIVRGGEHHVALDGSPSDREAQAERFDRVARTSPSEAARAILDGILEENPRLLIGKDARMIDWMQRLLPARYDVITRAVSRFAP